jgi:hypothetical protein
MMTSVIGGFPSTIRTDYCQPVAIFTPTEGHTYEVSFQACTVHVKDKNFAEVVRVSSYDKCELVAPRLSPKPAWLYLFKQ